MTTEREETSHLGRVCPVCDAAVGEPCVTVPDRRRRHTLHDARTDFAPAPTPAPPQGPAPSSITVLLLHCYALAQMCDGEARKASGDARTSAWWQGRAADWRRHAKEIVDELQGVAHARAAQ